MPKIINRADVPVCFACGLASCYHCPVCLADLLESNHSETCTTENARLEKMQHRQEAEAAVERLGAQSDCVACGGSGVNSRGGSCEPCAARAALARVLDGGK